jgi:GTP-binding protein Era
MNKSRKKAPAAVPVLPAQAVSPQRHGLCGFVAVVGRANSGKSTLVNNIVGEKIAIVSPVPQTTRNALRGVYTDRRGQIVFIDTPGWHMGRDGLDKFMNRSCQNALDGVDCIVHLADTSKPVGEEEFMVVERLKGLKVPVILGLNKIDLKGEFMGQYIALWEQAKGKNISEVEGLVLLPLSGKEGTQVDRLLDIIFSFLPQGPFHYEEDIVTDIPRKQVVADVIREKLFLSMREELPHSIAVNVEEIRPARGKTTRISAVILVERDSQKEIVIGAKGQMVKTIGIAARAELEALIETRVFLELHVKTQKNWRDDHYMLAEMGYSL